MDIRVTRWEDLQPAQILPAVFIILECSKKNKKLQIKTAAFLQYWISIPQKEDLLHLDWFFANFTENI